MVDCDRGMTALEEIARQQIIATSISSIVACRAPGIGAQSSPALARARANPHTISTKPIAEMSE